MHFVSFISKNLLRRKVRSALTVIGVTVAVAAVVALLSIADGLIRSYSQVFEGRKVDLVVNRAGATEKFTSSLDERIRARIEAIPGVHAVIPGLIDLITFEKEGLIGVPIQGRDPRSNVFEHLNVIQGRALDEGDRNHVVLGALLAKNLGRGLGNEVEIEGEQFRVVGIFESRSVMENASAIVPLAELQRVLGRPNHVTGFQVILEETPDKEAALERVRQQIESLRDDSGRPLHLVALPVQDFVNTSYQIKLARSIAWVISGVALILGAVGVLNTMFMSVFERTREIGVLRSLGWRKGRILRMVLSESVLLSLFGAVAGSALAVTLVRLLSRFPAASAFVEGATPLSVLVQGVVFAALIGFLGGLSPAYRATRIQPTEALRHE
jgi:putative ABC transport system permease protein